MIQTPQPACLLPLILRFCSFLNTSVVTTRAPFPIFPLHRFSLSFFHLLGRAVPFDNRIFAEFFVARFQPGLSWPVLEMSPPLPLVITDPSISFLFTLKSRVFYSSGSLKLSMIAHFFFSPAIWNCLLFLHRSVGIR